MFLSRVPSQGRMDRAVSGYRFPCSKAAQGHLKLELCIPLPVPGSGMGVFSPETPCRWSLTGRVLAVWQGLTHHKEHPSGGCRKHCRHPSRWTQGNRVVKRAHMLHPGSPC